VLWKALKSSWLGVQRAPKVEKVTHSQDEDFVGALKKHANMLTLLPTSAATSNTLIALKVRDRFHVEGLWK
jgi:hypothetical protein